MSQFGDYLLAALREKAGAAARQDDPRAAIIDCLWEITRTAGNAGLTNEAEALELVTLAIVEDESATVAAQLQYLRSLNQHRIRNNGSR